MFSTVSYQQVLSYIKKSYRKTYLFKIRHYNIFIVSSKRNVSNLDYIGGDMFSIQIYVFLLALTKTYAFDAGFIAMGTSRAADKDTTHYGITVCALCRVTIDYLKTTYKVNLTHLDSKFNEQTGQCDESLVKDIVNNLRAAQIQNLNVWEYSQTIKTIASSNTKTDLKEVFKEESHFDSESFVGGSNLIIRRYRTALNSILNEDNYDQARKNFGAMLHTLQVCSLSSIRTLLYFCF